MIVEAVRENCREERMQSAMRMVVAVAVSCLSLPAFADTNVTFTNGTGAWQSTGSGVGSTTLQLAGATLDGVSNLMAPYNCPVGSTMCSGTVTLLTGTLFSGHANPANPCPAGGCTPAIFNPGGSFMVTSTGAGGGFTFSGQFSSASWQKFGAGTLTNPNFWTFIGQITNATLTLGNGQVFSNISAGTIQFTTVGGQPISGGGGLQWSNNTGSTNFPSPVPEPGSLALLGSGLVSLGFVLKRRITGRAPDTSRAVDYP